MVPGKVEQSVAAWALAAQDSSAKVALPPTRALRHEERDMERTSREWSLAKGPGGDRMFAMSTKADTASQPEVVAETLSATIAGKKGRGDSPQLKTWLFNS